MATLDELIKRRNHIQQAMQAKGGPQNAPVMAKQIADLTAQIKQLKGGGGDAGATTTPTTKEIAADRRDIAGEAGKIALDQLGSVRQTFAPELTKQYSEGDLAADRGRVEEDVYGRLTRNLDDRQKYDTESAQQSLYNRGIAYNADPNSRYQQELRDLRQGYDDARLNARRTATEMGGAEFQRNQDLNRQQRESEYAIQSGTRGQNMSDISALTNLGIGNIQGFEQLNDADKLRALQKAIAQLQAKTSVDVANIGAGASKYAADKASAGRGGGEEEGKAPFNPAR